MMRILTKIKNYFTFFEKELETTEFNEKCLTDIVCESEFNYDDNIVKSVISLIDDDFLRNASWDLIMNRVKNLVVIYDKKYKCIKYNKSFSEFLNISENYNDDVYIYKFFNKNMEFPKDASCPLNFGGKNIQFYRSYCYVHNSKDIFWVYDVPLNDILTNNKYDYVLRIYVKIKKMNKKCQECLTNVGYIKGKE